MKRQHILDQLPHSRPCWCADCKAAYSRIYRQTSGKKYSAKPKPREPRTRTRHITLKVCRCGQVRIGESTKPLCRDCYLEEVTKHQWDRRICRRCRKPWTSKSKRYRICPSCRRQAQQELPNLWRAQRVRGQCKDCGNLCEKFICNNCATQKRRMDRRIDKNRRRGAQQADRYRKREIAIRDGWLCHLCGGSVEPSLWGHHRHPESPNIDHIIPISRGGSDTASNVKLAHRVCNLRKHNKLPEELPTSTPDRVRAETRQ